MPVKFELEVLIEGKTKIIIQNPFDSESVLIHSKSMITAGDGIRKDVIEGKDIFATHTAANVFKFLNQKDIKTHYVGMFDYRTFIARKCKMFPVEIVVRRIAFGSYLKRNPEAREGEIFKEPVIELFFKNDENHDPLMVWNDGVGRFEHSDGEGTFDLYDSKKPQDSGGMGISTNVISSNIAMILEDIAMKVFLLLEEVWKKQEVTLVDLKIECGKTTDEQIVVADVIDNDSWRIWPEGNKSLMLDKQVYRDSEMTAKVCDNLKRNYALVAEMTGRFLL